MLLLTFLTTLQDRVRPELKNEEPWQATELSVGDDGNIIPVERSAGENKIGCVCWDCSVRTGNYPMGRRFVLIATDITHQSGSMSPAEDELYEKVRSRAVSSKYCLDRCNGTSGKRKSSS